MSAVSGSPVLLPFDATYSSGTQTIASFLSNSTSDPFPPPLACFPGLSTDVLGRLNTLETEVFGLPSATAATKFDEDCYPSRPIYGVLDILRLRLPFSDSRKGVAAQAAVLSRDVNSRVVVYNGELLSALPDASSTPTLTATTTDPRRFGTINNLDHVILHYLKSIPNVDVATALVQFVLSSPAVPPPSSSALATSLDSIPLLEVAVFGSVLPADIASVVSSYSAPNGTLFFGSDQSLAVRDWGIVATGSSVVWTDSALAAEVVRDTDLDDSTFNLVWDPAFTFMHSANPGVTVNVGNITSAFQSIDKTSP